MNTHSQFTVKSLPLRIHMLGICGTAMVALAGGLKAQGCRITGSDGQVYPPMSDQLKALAIPCNEGYAPENIPEDTELVIVGNVIRESNPEAEAMRQRGLPYLSMAEAVYRFLIADKLSIAAVGTHGKTTTTSLAAHTLVEAGGDPGVLVGGVAKNLNGNFRLGKGRYFVIEGDEYDTAYFDKTPKFFKYHPGVVLFTSLEFDHADIYSDLDQIRGHFRTLLKRLPADGLLVANGDDENVRALLPVADCQVITYGEGADVDCRIVDWQDEGHEARFQLNWQGREERWRLPMAGRYNAGNATAVRIMAGHLGFSAEAIAAAFSTFEGVRRRQEVRGEAGGVIVIDDFAHHPTAVRLTIEAMVKKYQGKRIWSVFEPRSFTARSARFQAEFTDAFRGAERLILAPPFSPEGASTDNLLDTEAIAATLEEQGQWAKSMNNTDAILDCLLRETKSGDVVLIMSNGGFDNIHARLLAGLGDRTSEPSTRQ